MSCTGRLQLHITSRPFLSVLQVVHITDPYFILTISVGHIICTYCSINMHCVLRWFTMSISISNLSIANGRTCTSLQIKPMERFSQVIDEKSFITSAEEVMFVFVCLSAG